MSANDKIRETVQAQEGILQWLLQTWREKNWVRLLLILDTILLIAFNPKTSSWALAIIEVQHPRYYTRVWLGVVILIFIVAVIIALRTKTTPKQVSIDERRTIKGLRPFHFDDSEIFDRLQRTEIIRECVSAIADTQFRFGVLSGQSGSGKTSFLQAGLWPALERIRHRCVYVKFTELEPLETLRTALVDQKLLSSDASEKDTVVKLLDACEPPDDGSLVLLFDQFEQFFLQHRRTNNRKPFIAGLADWYQTRSHEAIKVLVCIRSDFSDRLIELQKTMRYSLGPQENFRLDRFDPQQAAAVLRVIAQTEGITIDEAFVEEIANQQLAGSDDGLVSPVDIQILAWMIAGQNAVEDRAFNRAAYDALGGIEGLLEKFLKRALSARETPSRYHAALNVLLALTDFDSDSRAGALTLEQLAEKLENAFTRADLEEATDWLARSDVRLITPNQQGGILVYELAHERLIPALRRLAAKELSEVDVARRLLERKVSEWAVNGKQSHYLLRGRELRLVKRHRAQLIRNPQRDAKAKFLKRSLLQFRIKLVAAYMTFLLAAGAVFWWFSPSGQMWQAERDLTNLTTSINDSTTLYRVAKNLLRAGRLEEASRLARRLEPHQEVEILAQLRQHYQKIGAEQKVQDIKQREEEEQQLGVYGNPEEMIAMSIAYSKLGEVSNASRLLDKAKATINERSTILNRLWDITADRSDPSPLILAEAYQETGDSKRAAEELFRIFDSGSSNFDVNPTTLIDIALLCEELGSSYCDNQAWEKILRSGGTLSPQYSAALFSIAARAFLALGHVETAEDLLERGRSKLEALGLNSKWTQGRSYMPLHMSSRRYRKVQLWNPENGSQVREEKGAYQLDSKIRMHLFRAVTQSYINIATIEKDLSFVERAENSIVELELKDAADLYLSLAYTYLALGQKDATLEILSDVCNIADTEFKRDERKKLEELIYASLEKLSGAIHEGIDSDDGLSRTSKIWLLSLEAQRLWRIGRAEDARKMLSAAETITPRVPEPDDLEFEFWLGRGKLNSLILLAETCLLMGETDKATRYLDQVTERAATLSPEAKAETMSTLCDLYAKNGQWRRARQAADQTGSDVIKAVSLSSALAIWNETN
ncbi:MAG TPA: ATP-binding protein [Pyrinomonadaceae bacterium]|nr:ATP-binding protein [Pyrinomonadaceae bacterium]